MRESESRLRRNDIRGVPGTGGAALSVDERQLLQALARENRDLRRENKDIGVANGGGEIDLVDRGRYPAAARF